MKISSKLDQRGFAHLVVVLLVVVVVGVVGFAGYRVTQKDKTVSSVITSEAAKQAEADCKKETDDDDLCKFLSNWGDVKQFSIVSTSTAEGATSTSTIKVDGDKTYMKSEGELAYEVISIGNSTYTKSGDTWWKQTTKPSEEKPVDTSDYKYEEPDTDAPVAEQTKYEKQAKEACGNLQCFKYKVVDPGNTTTTEFIWFDDDDYKLRRSRSEGTDGTVNEQVYAYEGVSVTEPSPTKDLAPNQYIIPGQAEPVTIPDAASMQ